MFSEKLKELRKKNKLTQEKLAEILNIERSTIGKWETTTIVPQAEMLVRLSKLFNVTVDYLIGFDKNIELIDDFKEIVKIPVYGRIPAGIPIEALKDIIDYIDIPTNSIKSNKEYFALKVIGTSMYPKYLEDDIVLIEMNPDCESGQDCALYINGFDVTLKKVIKQENGLLLQPINPEFEAKFYPYFGKDIVRILGTVKQLIRFFK